MNKNKIEEIITKELNEGKTDNQILKILMIDNELELDDVVLTLASGYGLEAWSNEGWSINGNRIINDELEIDENLNEYFNFQISKIKEQI